MSDPVMRPGTCRSCGAPIVWVETELGTPMPLDVEPCPDGNITVEGGKARVLRATLFEQPPAGPRFKSHFSSCPHADMHRRKK